MSKRFTDTDKWKKQWFRELSPEHKNFWVYICDNCNHAGMWDVDFTLAEFIIGRPLDVPEIKKIFQKQYIEIRGGKKWFIRDFVDFQYGILKADSRTHQSVIDILQKEGVWKEYTKGIQWDKGTVLVLVKDKGTVKDKDKEAEFEGIWTKYPRKIGKKEAYRHFQASVKSSQDLKDIHKALDNYLNSANYKKGYVWHAKRFFNNWRDYIEQPDPYCSKCKNTGKVVNKITGYPGPCDCPVGKRLEREA